MKSKVKHEIIKEICLQIKRESLPVAGLIKESTKQPFKGYKTIESNNGTEPKASEKPANSTTNIIKQKGSY